MGVFIRHRHGAPCEPDVLRVIISVSAAFRRLWLAINTSEKVSVSGTEIAAGVAIRGVAIFGDIAHGASQAFQDISTLVIDQVLPIRLLDGVLWVFGMQENV